MDSMALFQIVVRPEKSVLLCNTFVIKLSRKVIVPGLYRNSTKTLKTTANNTHTHILFFVAFSL